jgi:hypothetical protein
MKSKEKGKRRVIFCRHFGSHATCIPMIYLKSQMPKLILLKPAIICRHANRSPVECSVLRLDIILNFCAGHTDRLLLMFIALHICNRQVVYICNRQGIHLNDNLQL